MRSVAEPPPTGQDRAPDEGSTMRLSKRCEYGIKAAVRLARKHGQGYVQSKELADTEALPAKFLESILLTLRGAAILESKVGAGGGYRLSRPPDQISVSDLLEALDPGEPVSHTTIIEPKHATAGGVALHLVSERIDEAMGQAIGSLSLAELLSLVQERAPESDGSMYYI